jgi:preprotein translocase subunit SecF
VRDNSRGLGATGKLSYTDVVNLSMNQTLARSINTSLVAILPILAVLVLGAEILGAVTLEYFGLALLIGLTSGAYSSIFIASPLLAMLKEREPRYRQIRDRLESRGTAMQLLSPAAVAAGALSTADPATGGKRRGASKAAAGRSATLRPAAARSGAVPAGDDMLDDEDASAGTGAPGQGAGGKLAAPRPAGTPRAGGSGRPGGQAPRGGTPPRRPPTRPRKKGKRR